MCCFGLCSLLCDWMSSQTWSCVDGSSRMVASVTLEAAKENNMYYLGDALLRRWLQTDCESGEGMLCSSLATGW